MGDIQIHGICLSYNDIFSKGGVMTSQISNDNAKENLDKLYDARRTPSSCSTISVTRG